jgi:intracellular septation protein A
MRSSRPAQTPPAVGPLVLSRRQVVVAVARRGGPKVIEATLIPGVLFYVCLIWGGLGLAYLTAVSWIYACVARRWVQRRPVPPLLVLAAVGITVRTAVAIWSGSSFIYFMQPILGTVATGGVFVVSLIIDRPLIGRFAGDFWPITREMAENPRIMSLFRGLTVLWAGVNLATASLTLILLLSLPVTTFVAAKQLSGLGITLVAITVTIMWSHRIACREGIVRAPSRAAVTVG